MFWVPLALALQMRCVGLAWAFSTPAEVAVSQNSIFEHQSRVPAVSHLASFFTYLTLVACEVTQSVNLRGLSVSIAPFQRNWSM